MVRLILLIALWLAFGAAMYADERRAGIEETSDRDSKREVQTPQVQYKQFDGVWRKSVGGGDWILCPECNETKGGVRSVGSVQSPMTPPPIYSYSWPAYSYSSPNYSAIPNSSYWRGVGAGITISGGFRDVPFGDT